MIEIYKSDRMQAAVKQANKIYQLNLCDDNDVDIFNSFFKEVITKTLNNIEYFAMNFKFKIANHKVIYESLHQSYIQLVDLLYYYIAKSNDKGKGEKYYKSTIWLYNKWKKHQLRDKKRDKEKNDKQIKQIIDYRKKTMKFLKENN